MKFTLSEAALLIVLSPILFPLGIIGWLISGPISKFTHIPFIIVCNSILTSQFIGIAFYFNISLSGLVIVCLVQTITGYGAAMLFSDKEQWINGYNGENILISSIPTLLTIMLIPALTKIFI